MNKKLKDMAIHAFVRSYAKKGPLQNFFVFGYGSLMYPSGVNGRGMDYYYDWDSLKLARLKGYKRGMYAGHSIVSYYGILPCEDKEHTINGILMKRSCIPWENGQSLRKPGSIRRLLTRKRRLVITRSK